MDSKHQKRRRCHRRRPLRPQQQSARAYGLVGKAPLEQGDARQEEAHGQRFFQDERARVCS